MLEQPQLRKQPDDRRKLQKRRFCTHDWIKHGSENPIKTENVHPYGVFQWKPTVPAPLNMSIYFNEFSITDMAFLEFPTNSQGSNKTNNRLDG